MIPALGIALEIGARLLPKLLSGLTGAGAMAAAAIAAIPATLEAAGRILKAIGESPVLSLLFGAVLGGVLSAFYVHSLDAPIRERQRAAAIREANKRADAAIESNRLAYENKLAEFRRQIAAKSKR